MNKYLRRAANIRVIGTVSTITLAALAFFTIFPISHQSDQAAADAIPSSTEITIDASRSIANVDITPISDSGTFNATNSVSNIAFSVTTDNLTGYSLVLSGSDATGALTNTDYGDTLASISGAVDANTFETGPSATYANKWGIKPNKLNSANNPNYLPAPTNATSISINETSGKNTTADSYTIDLGARVDYTKPIGAYTNTFVLQAISKPVLYEIEYTDNTGASNLPSKDTGSVTNIAGYKLSTTTPTRTGYTFMRWCDGTVTHVAAGDSTCSGTTYAAGANYTIATPSSTIKTTVTLKAMWSANTHNVTKKYRLQNADGTWGSYTTESTTTARYGATISYSKQINNYKANGGANNSTVSASKTMPDANTELALDFYRNTYACKISYRYQNANDNNYGTATVAVNTTKRYQESCSWSTANISGFDSATFNTNSYSGTINNADINATVSITRKTYTLTINRNTSYISAVSGAGTYKAGQSVSISATTSYSNFTKWTLTNSSGSQISTAASTTYTMPSGNTTIYANGDRPNMADFTKSTCSTRASSGNIWVYDARDNQYYTVRYINGNCWMTRNIAIGCNGSGASYGSGRTTRSLTTANSNVSATWSTGNAYSLDKNDGTSGCTTSDTSGCDSYTVPRMKCSNTNNRGAWYNYKAATAGYINGTSDTREANYSICPINWRLPSHNNHLSVVSYRSAFSPVTGGYYAAGVTNQTSWGYWYSSTPGIYNETRWELWETTVDLGTGEYAYRANGHFIRCIRSS